MDACNRCIKTAGGFDAHFNSATIYSPWTIAERVIIALLVYFLCEVRVLVVQRHLLSSTSLVDGTLCCEGVHALKGR